MKRLDRLWYKSIFAVIRAATAGRSSAGRLAFLFGLDNRLYDLEGETAIRFENGVHPKHRLLNYHAFFKDNIRPGESVLDVGCGSGEMSCDIAENVSGVRVLGIDTNAAKIVSASRMYIHRNLAFKQGDIRTMGDLGHYDVVVLSNVLEHIEKRVELLVALDRQARPDRFLIRVPLFERDWRVPLKKELGVEHRLDPTHCIEYTMAEFKQELDQAGLVMAEHKVCWGELWCVAKKRTL